MSLQKDKKGLVSVIIPTYNRMGTLERSIKSVLMQTYDNLELWIIDDGSTDGTEEYVRGLQDTRVNYYRNERNMGPSASRNKGATLANGDYLAFQDSDDEWKPDKLEKTMDILMQSDENTGMVYHEMQEQSGNGEVIPSPSISLSDKAGEIFEYMLLYPLIGIPAAVIKKSCFERIGGFSEKIKSFEDYEFFLRVAKKYKIAFVQEPLILIYDTPGSVNKQYKNKIDAELYILKNEYESLRSYGILQRKIELIRMQADNYGCEDYFYEKIFEMCKEARDPEWANKIMECVHLAAMRIAGNDRGDRSVYYQNAAEQIERLVASLSRLQRNIKNNTQVLLQNKTSVYQALRDVLSDLESYTDLALYPQKETDELAEIEAKLVAGANSVPVIGNVLDEVLIKGKELLHQIGAARCICTSCGKQVRLLPLSPYHKMLRAHLGNPDEGVEYLFENEEKDRCPVCGATQQIRFLLGFLEDVQPDGEEKLRVCFMAPADDKYLRVASFIRSYAESRDYMEYSLDETRKTDVWILMDIFDGKDDIGKIQRVRSALADNGICILVLTAMAAKEAQQAGQSVKRDIIGPGKKYVQHCYTQDELADLMQQTGFEMQVADQSWFGPEYYAQCGFGDSARLFMLTPQWE